MGTRSKATDLVRLKTDFSRADPVATPIFQSSAFRSGDPYFYTRNANPNFREVEELLARLDGGGDAVLYASGMAAIDAALSLLRPGDALAAHELLYGCSYRFLSDHCARLGVELSFGDLSDPAASRTLLGPRTRMVFLETPTNPFLRTVPVEPLARAARSLSPDVLVVVDNTWATPLFQNPLELGADLALYSCSKFFSGHSDLILGAAVARDAKLSEALRRRRFYAGAVPDPFAAWLLRRSLQTLDLRLERHQANTREVAEFLRGRSEVKTVYYPEVDGRQLKGYGGMLFLELAGDADGRLAERFAASLALFDRGTPLASVASAVAIPYAGSHLSMTAAEKSRIGLTPSLLRLSVGIESAADLIGDLEAALLATRPGAVKVE